MAKIKSSAATKTSKADIFMSIKPEHINNISLRLKNHEYRRYLLPPTVRRIWFYTTAPLSRLEYVDRISHGKVPGEVQEDGGFGNADFNAGRKLSKYGYEILDLWKLNEGVSLREAVTREILKGPPQKYCWASLAFLESCPLDRQDHIFSREAQEEESPTKTDPTTEECKEATLKDGQDHANSKTLEERPIKRRQKPDLE
ncbi:hypothetical protein FQN54_007038 [Arachnomyces sp. PD_36]|nr:hypothetical protein FQN54_007038 [Arachnomyces sp. PD_36]